jgi:hypothetical protein
MENSRNSLTGSAQAQQVPIPTTAAEVPGPPPGTAMTKEYVQMVGRMAYIWGWPLVNGANRAIASSKAPPGCIRPDRDADRVYPSRRRGQG